MSWIAIQKFAAETDLHVLAHNLRAAELPHQFTDEIDGQLLWVPDREVAAKVQVVVNLYLRDPDKIVQTHPHPKKNAPMPESPIPKFSQAPITYVLLALSILGYLMGMAPLSWRQPLYFFPIPLDGFVWPAVWHYWLATHEYWRIITPTFLHWSAVHIIFNGLALVDFGGRLERQLPRMAYLGLFLFTAIVSNFGQFTFVPRVDFGGISGALFGYFGCILAIQWLAPKSALRLPLVFVLFSMGMLAAGIMGFLDKVIGPMANGAHLTGLAAGFVYGCFIAIFFKKRLEAAAIKP